MSSTTVYFNVCNQQCSPIPFDINEQNPLIITINCKKNPKECADAIQVLGNFYAALAIEEAVQINELNKKKMPANLLEDVELAAQLLRKNFSCYKEFHPYLHANTNQLNLQNLENTQKILNSIRTIPRLIDF